MSSRRDKIAEQLLVTIMRHIYQELLPARDSLRSHGLWRAFTVRGAVTRETVDGQLLLENLLGATDNLVEAIDGSLRTENNCDGIRELIRLLREERKIAALSMSLEDSARQHAHRVLAAVRGNKAAAGRILRVSRGTLCRLLNNGSGQWQENS